MRRDRAALFRYITQMAEGDYRIEDLVFVVVAVVGVWLFDQCVLARFEAKKKPPLLTKQKEQ